LHNIRLRFEAEGIWNVFSNIYPDYINQSNKDIKLESWLFNDDIDIIVTIHYIDTVTVALACSYQLQQI
jgi:L-ribulose-5-phosphate 3-epimerase UlaE